jgi:hypothetical protein
MLRIFLAILLALFTIFLVDQDRPAVNVSGPTMIAFFAPIKHPETDAEGNQALAEFKKYAAQVREPLQRAGIDFQEMYAESFDLRINGKLTTFSSGHMKIGYYFVAPDKNPRIEYGIAPPAQLLQVAREYFNLPIR